MGTRRAFQLYIKHQLELMVDDGSVDLTREQILDVIMEIEDDPDFHDKVSEILDDVVYDLRSEGVIQEPLERDSE